MIDWKYLKAWWGDDHLTVIVCPRRDLTPEGHLVVGFHVNLVFRKGFYSVSWENVAY